MGSFSIWHWLVVLVLVALIFGTKKLGNIGTDLGAAIKGFKKGMKDASSDDAAAPAQTTQRVENGEAIDVQARETSNAEQKT